MRKGFSSRLTLGTLVLFLFSTQSGLATILPPNDLHLQDDLYRRDANMTEEQFLAIVKKAVDFYAPIVEMHKAKLVAVNDWKDSTVNAYAQQKGNTWEIRMFGGLARRPETTPDGFALVACHELGHHLAGFVFNKGSIFSKTSWAACEGQSDYFATQSCARNLWAEETEENAKHAKSVDSFAKSKCDEAWSEENDRNLCYRTANASQSLANLLAALGKGDAPKFDTPDKNEVGTTYTAHPKAQCRLDTYFAGSICGREFDAKVIPAKNHAAGQYGKDAELEAAKYSCHTVDGFKVGVRPRCWFKPGV